MTFLLPNGWSRGEFSDARQQNETGRIDKLYESLKNWGVWGKDDE